MTSTGSATCAQESDIPAMMSSAKERHSSYAAVELSTDTNSDAQRPARKKRTVMAAAGQRRATILNEQDFDSHGRAHNSCHR
jgi:hypothetical protein